MIIAFPALIPFIRPFSETVAILELLDMNVTFLLVAFNGLTVAFIVVVPFTPIVTF